ncbi:MAG: SMI1/KNR4 family protein [Polyangiaceae bacterium]
MRDAFLLIAGYTTHWHSRWDHQYEAKAAAMSEAMNALATAVGPATDKTVRMRLSAWGYAAAKSLALPKELPTTVEDALALYATLGLTKDTLALGKSAGAAARGLPAPLRAFYAAHGSLGSRTIVREKSLASKTKSLAAWRKIALEDLEDDVDRGTLHPQNLTPKALALGTTSSGDVYFLDVGLDLGTEEPPVFRFSHDEGHSEIVASTLGAFIAGEVLAAAIADGPLASKLERLRAKDRKRIKLPAALAKAPR